MNSTKRMDPDLPGCPGSRRSRLLRGPLCPDGRRDPGDLVRRCGFRPGRRRNPGQGPDHPGLRPGGSTEKIARAMASVLDARILSPGEAETEGSLIQRDAGLRVRDPGPGAPCGPSLLRGLPAAPGGKKGLPVLHERSLPGLRPPARHRRSPCGPPAETPGERLRRRGRVQLRRIQRQQLPEVLRRHAQGPAERRRPGPGRDTSRAA
ncbi:MAG: hypothetical protein M0C28_23440 [Candidatus Moduliflexus flocculans]|nr:hypothetical protein [Candidatus Moduliflexus flocculans]